MCLFIFKTRGAAAAAVIGGGGCLGGGRSSSRIIILPLFVVGMLISKQVARAWVHHGHVGLLRRQQRQQHQRLHLPVAASVVARATTLTTAAASAAAAKATSTATTAATTRIIGHRPYYHHRGGRQQHGGGRRSAAATSLYSTTTTATTTAASSNDAASSSSTSNAADEQKQNLVADSTRISRGDDQSLELKTLTGNLEMVLSHLRARRAAEDTLDAARRIADMASQRSKLIQERDGHLQRRKQLSAQIGRYMRRQDELTAEEKDELENARQSSTAAADGAAAAEEELDALQTTMDTLLAGIPNLLDDVVPDGTDEDDNEEIYKWGDIDALPRELGWNTDDDSSFEPVWHDQVATNLGGYLTEAAVKMSGARFVALSGDVARLERALGAFFMDLHTSPEHGYTEVSVPLVVGRTALQGTSQLPKFEEDLFAITEQSHTCNGERAFLIPTAEVPVTNLHSGGAEGGGDILEEDDLPLSYVACTPCFRAEAGSYGRDTKGLIRTHQFTKVELVRITTPETSEALHEELTGHAEACLRLLKLPYRKVRLCSGDAGFAAAHCYDLEVWLPGAKEYREISSCSNTRDFQARRMGLRYRPNVSSNSSPPATPPEKEQQQPQQGKKKKKNKSPKKPKPVFCHTMNGSGLAVGRTLVAVLENYQRPDGSVVVPEVLRPYMGKDKDVLYPPSSSSGGTKKEE